MLCLHCASVVRSIVVCNTQQQWPGGMDLLLVVGKAMCDGCTSAAGGAASNWFEE